MEDFYFKRNSKIAELAKDGLVRKIGKGFYTSAMDDETLNSLLKFNWPLIVKNLFPNSVIAFRSALEFRPSPEGYIFLISNKNKESKFGNIIFKEIRNEYIFSETDSFVMMEARATCIERTMLDLYKTAKRTPADDRYIDKDILEKRLETILIDSSEEKLNTFRDKAKKISEELNLSPSFKILNSTILALLGTGDLKGESNLVKNRSSKFSIDKKREYLFERLATELSVKVPPDLNDVSGEVLHNSNKSFFESYFSNYIEGTEFLIEEAEDIIFSKTESVKRPQDSHDISGTYGITNNDSFMKRVCSNSKDFLLDLQRINKEIIPLRTDKNPGEWKDKKNRAGNTIFVIPEDVVGTLTKGFEISKRLKHPFLRGIFLAFVVSEVHPFLDGNGRTSRLILNRELRSSGLSSLIIPTVYRDDYMEALKNLTRRGLSDPYYRMFLRAWKFSTLNFSDYQEIKKKLISDNWFEEPVDAKITE